MGYYGAAMPGELPLCVVCGALARGGAPACAHARVARARWVGEPWWRVIAGFAGTAIGTLLFAAVLAGIGPLIGWLAYGWPPQGWIEILGVIGVALVSIPGVVVGVGLVLSIPELYPGRAWELRDREATDEAWWRGWAHVRGGRVRGQATLHLRTRVPGPSSCRLSSEDAARCTGDPARVIAAALAGLAASGRLAVSREKRVGWSRDALDEAPRPIAGLEYTLRAVGSPAAEGPWVERALLAALPPGQEVALAEVVASVVQRVALEAGCVSGDEDSAPSWDPTHARALRAAILGDEEPRPPERPARVDAELDGWRRERPDAGEVLDALTQGVRAALTGGS